MKDLLDTTGKRIRIHREDLGLNQHEVAEMLMKMGVGVGQSRLSKIERQGRPPSGEVLMGLSKILGVSADYLLLLTDDPTPHNELDTLDSAYDDDPLMAKMRQYWDMIGMTDRVILLNVAARLADQNVVAFVGRPHQQLEDEG